jgi:hypothetical protein
MLGSANLPETLLRSGSENQAGGPFCDDVRISLRPHLTSPRCAVQSGSTPVEGIGPALTGKEALSAEKPSRKAIARHELSMSLFGYCRGKCGMPHIEQKGELHSTSRSIRRRKSAQPKPKRSRKARQRARRIAALALSRLAAIKTSWVTDPGKMMGPYGRGISSGFESKRSKH